MNSLKERIEALPELNIFVESKAEAILKDLIKEFNERHTDITLIESDPNLMQLENIAYRDAFYSVSFNNKIKLMLPHYCEKEDLDNFIFGFYGGELRHLGEEPTAPYSFELDSALSTDVIVPKGFILSSSTNVESHLMENVSIPAGTLKAQGILKLDLKVKQSDIKTQTPVSTLPFVIKVEALEEFSGGSNRESDEEFFERAILSLYKYSTAGSKKAYEYFCKLADERVFDVKVSSPKPNEIDLYILPSVESALDDILSNVRAMHSKDKVQAFCDVVRVKAASKKEVILSPLIHLLDLTKQSEVIKNINENFKTSFKIGQNLPFSKAIKALEIANVYEVELSSDTDLSVEENEYLNITITPTFKEASYE